MKKIIILGVFCLSTISLFAQSIKRQVIASGEAMTSENKNVKSTIGQAFSGIYSADGFRMKVGYRVYVPLVLANVDTDGDGIMDDVDQCPNSKPGAIVNLNGCEIFNLAADNYQLVATSASCIGSATGAFKLTLANKAYTYSIKTTGPAAFARTASINASQTNAYSLTGLSKGSYSVCVTIPSQPGYEQCFDVTISEPAALKTTSAFDPTSNVVTLQMSGSDKYLVTVNGVTETVRAASYSKVLGTGLNTVTVSTDLGCQGAITEEIFLSEDVVSYPNPTTGIVRLFVPGVDKQVQVSVNSMNATFSNEVKEIKANREVELDLTQMPVGTYVIQVQGEHVRKTLKIVKQ